MEASDDEFFFFFFCFFLIFVLFSEYFHTFPLSVSTELREVSVSRRAVHRFKELLEIFTFYGLLDDLSVCSL